MLPKNASLCHVALAVHKMDECEEFYNMLGMKTEFKTQDYVYLSGYGDNISLHRVEDSFSGAQRLEHIGFALDSISSVNVLYAKNEIYKNYGSLSTKNFWNGCSFI